MRLWPWIVVAAAVALYSGLSSLTGTLAPWTRLEGLALTAPTPAQIALAWTVREPGVMAIPRTGSADHTRENAAAAGIELSARDLAEIDGAFPPPKKARPLEML